MSYLKKNRKYIFAVLLLALAYNMYFIFLLPEHDISYLLYLDMLLVLGGLAFFVTDYVKHKKAQQHIEDLIQSENLIYTELGSFENDTVAIHDIKILEQQLSEQFEANCNLQDYITHWCHEVKIPLAAALLMAEKVEENNQKKMLQEQLEKINQQLSSALLGCKVQSSILDIQMQKVNLLEILRTSIKNNQFFLIRNQFELDLAIDESIMIYTDKSWMVYVVDQFLSNAIKYASDNPEIRIWATKQDELSNQNYVSLCIEDNGEGIKESDIRRIFEKGFTGSNHHNGQYKSTGMGLYMVSVILEKLGHAISVKSEFGSYTRFEIQFFDSRGYFMKQ